MRRGVLRRRAPRRAPRNHATPIAPRSPVDSCTAFVAHRTARASAATASSAVGATGAAASITTVTATAIATTHRRRSARGPKERGALAQAGVEAGVEAPGFRRRGRRPEGHQDCVLRIPLKLQIMKDMLLRRRMRLLLGRMPLELVVVHDRGRGGEAAR